MKIYFNNEQNLHREIYGGILNFFKCFKGQFIVLKILKKFNSSIIVSTFNNVHVWKHQVNLGLIVTDDVFQPKTICSDWRRHPEMHRVSQELSHQMALRSAVILVQQFYMKVQVIFSYQGEMTIVSYSDVSKNAISASEMSKSRQVAVKTVAARIR